MAGVLSEEEEDDEAAASPSGHLSAEEYLRKHNITISDTDVPPPAQSFADADLPPSMLAAFTHSGYTVPTTIQACAWPIAATGRDLVAIASTGSGKTCGFLAPGLQHIRNSGKNPRAGPIMLVLAPTRELARQIQDEATRLGRSMRIRNTCLYGGAPRGRQAQELRDSPHIVIATPGRLLDFIQSRELDLGQVSYFVLDEADRMLDMGFEPAIQDVVAQLPTERQTMFFSATWPKEVKAIARKFVRNDPVHVFIGNVQEGLVANKDITQIVKLVDSRTKLDETLAYLRSKPRGTRFIIFTATKRGADRLEMEINYGREFSAAAIHGDKTQNARDAVIHRFKQGRTNILVATDVAARGLDISNVGAVINYDFPNEIEMYIHRIGRTGRAGHAGEAYTLMTRSDRGFAPELEQIMRDAQQVVPPELAQMAAGARRDHVRKPDFRGGGGGGSSFRSSSRGGYGSSFRGSSRGGGGGYDRRGSDREGGGRYGQRRGSDGYESSSSTGGGFRGDSRSHRGRQYDDGGNAYGRGRGGSSGGGGSSINSLDDDNWLSAGFQGR